MENKYTDEQKILYDTVERVFEALYAKGRLEYKKYITHNDAFFALRPNKRATIITFEIDADIDKVNPMSESYDPKYVETLKKTNNIDDIKKYLGQPNLVVVVVYEWNNEQLTKLQETFRKITEEIVQTFISNGEDVTEDELYNKFNFRVYPDITDHDPDMVTGLYSNENLCEVMEFDEMMDVIYKILKKYNLGKLQFINRLCDTRGELYQM